MKTRNMFAAVAAGVSLVAFGDYADDYLSVSGPAPTCKTFGSRRVYVFTGTTGPATVTAKKDMALEEFLVVGGGGGGGGACGGGGGGGGVIHSNDVRRVAANDVLTVTVGAGGAGAASDATSCNSGGHSVLGFGGISVTAYGGGGGGKRGVAAGSSETGEIGSGGGVGFQGTIGREGIQWNQGHCGGRTTLSDANNSSPGGGGGGAGSAADWDFGGEGLAFSITGANVVYGSGGGGGSTSSITIGCKGGTNAGNGGHAKAGGNGVAGTGSGGGAGGSSKSGGAGGSGTVILAFTERAADTSRFAVAEIPDQLLVGSAVEPSVTVTDDDGNVLTAGQDYAVSYVDNDADGTAVAIVSGAAGTEYEGFAEIRPFAVRAVAYEDEYVRASDAGVCRTNVDKCAVYVFTNVAAQVVVRAKRSLLLGEYLVVGGGGAGGCTGGGGGGGGGYVSGVTNFVFERSGQFNLQVGAGGVAHPGTTTCGPCGRMGGHSWLNFGEGKVFAYGGGGGGGKGVASPDEANEPTRAAVTNEIGSAGGDLGQVGVKGGPEHEYVAGVHWNPDQGHKGGVRGYSAAGTRRGAGGGGAGFDGAAKNGTGGEGVTNSITGVAVVYGSGGGGGTVKASSFAAGAGGTNAGDGGTYGTSGTLGGAGVDGTGAGGGGGGTKSSSSGANVSGGGNGGSGTVILSFKPVSGFRIIVR